MTFGTGATDGSEKAPIGESIIAPDAQAYEIEIDLAQKVAKYEDRASATLLDWYEYTFNTIKTIVKLVMLAQLALKLVNPMISSSRYMAWRRFKVSTVLEPWIFGEKIDVVTE